MYEIAWCPSMTVINKKRNLNNLLDKRQNKKLLLFLI